MKFIFVFLLLSFVACENQGEQEKDKEEKPLQVLLEEIKEETLFESLAFAGKVEPTVKRGLYAKSSGVVTEVFPKLGDKLKKNSSILTVSPRDIGFQGFVVKAPIEGFLTELAVELGRRVEQNQFLGIVAKLDKFETTVQASLKDLSYLKVGAEVEVILAQHTRLEQRPKGLVKEISPVADPVTGSFSIRVDILCDEGDRCYESLKAGTYVKVLFKKNKRLGIKVPSHYLVDEKSKVILLKEGDLVERVEISLGKNYGDFVEITKGLSAGDRVVVSSSRHAKDGEKAIVTE